MFFKYHILRKTLPYYRMANNYNFSSVRVSNEIIITIIIVCLTTQLESIFHFRLLIYQFLGIFYIFIYFKIFLININNSCTHLRIYACVVYCTLLCFSHLFKRFSNKNQSEILKCGT